MLIELFYALHCRVWRILPYLVVFSFFALMGFQFGLPDGKAYLLSLVATLVACSVLFFVGRKVPREHRIFPAFEGVNLLFVVILFGTLLRVAWLFLFPVDQVSDSASYVGLANQLIDGRPYGEGGNRAYWPPGYAFFLYITHLGALEVTDTSVAIVNTLLYWASSVVLYLLARHVTDSRVALVSVVLLALWPTHITLISIASKELVVVLLLLLVAWVNTRDGKWFYPLLVGLLLGTAVLVQPGVILFVSVFIVANWASRMSGAVQLKRLVLTVLGIVLVIAPWSYRNYKVFDEFVLISTNGGFNLYRANNEDAHGGYLAQGRVDLSGYDEVTRNRLGSELAREWITSHPVDFAVLSFRKMVLFLGDDSLGVYETTKRAALEPIESNYGYLALKLVSTSYWLLIWFIFMLNRAKIDAFALSRDRIAVSLSLSFLYFFTVHSVFESNSKYHIPVVWVLFIMVAFIAYDARNRAVQKLAPGST